MSEGVKMSRQHENARKTVWQAVKFTCFSAGAGIVQALSFTLLNELTGFPYWPSYLIALVLSVLFNFTLNRKFTFKSAGNVPLAMTKVFCYYLIFTPLSTWGGDELTRAGVNEYIVLAGTMLTNFVTEFLYSKYFVFRDALKSKEEPAE